MYAHVLYAKVAIHMHVRMYMFLCVLVKVTLCLYVCTYVCSHTHLYVYVHTAMWSVHAVNGAEIPAMSAETVAELKRELTDLRNRVNSLLDVLDAKKRVPVTKEDDRELATAVPEAEQPTG